MCTLVGHIFCIGVFCELFIASKVQQIRTQIRCTDFNVKLAVNAVDKTNMKA
jgi:hypothetical protein